jgi:outer membrane receptor for ferrienterochelin and colicins
MIAYGFQPRLLAPTLLSLAAIAAEDAVPSPHVASETIVITGTRSAYAVSDAPVRTEVVTSSQIKDRQARTLYEALEGVPGIRVEEQCSACNFSQIRAQGLDVGRTAVLIDSQQLFTGLAGVYGLQLIPASSIERIEITKGSGSALYGGSALGGIVNVITKEPTSPGGHIGITVGEHGTNTFMGDATAISGGNALTASFQKFLADATDENGDGQSDRVQTDALTAGLSGRFDHVGHGTLKTALRFIQDDRQGGDMTTIDNPFAEGSEHIQTNRLEGTMAYDVPLGQRDLLSCDVGYGYHNRSATNDTFVTDYQTSFGTLPTSDQINPYLAEEDQYIGGLRYTMGRDAHVVTVGLSGLLNLLDESGNYVDPNVPAPYRSESDKRTMEAGLFAQDEWQVNDAWQCVLGARIDYHQSREVYRNNLAGGPPTLTTDYDNTAVNPRLAVKYDVGQKLTLRATAGSGSRVAYGFSEDLHLASGSPRVYKPASLEPERSYSGSLSADWNGDRLDAGISVFYNRLLDSIAFTSASAQAEALGYDYEFANVGNAYTAGIEGNLQVEFIDDLQASLNGTYTRGYYDEARPDWVGHASGMDFADDSKHISRLPDWTAGVDLAYAPGPLRIAAGAQVTGPMWIDYNAEGDPADANSRIVRTSPFAVVNAKISYAWRSAVLFAGARNIFDEVQEDRRTDDTAFYYAPLYGRVAYAGFDLTF